MSKESNSKQISNQDNLSDYLIVEEGVGASEDPSVIQITQKRMDDMNLLKAENILLKGKKGKETLCICLPDSSGDLLDNHIRMGNVVRKNLGVQLGDLINAKKAAKTYCCGDYVHILPFEDSIKNLSEEEKESLCEKYLIPYFRDCFRPIHEGDYIIIKKEDKTIEFKIMYTYPKKFCVVGPDTIILNYGSPLKRESIEKEENETPQEQLNQKDEKNEELIKENKSLIEIITKLQNDIKEKDKIIQGYHNNNPITSPITSIKPGEKMMTVNFVTMSSKLVSNYSLACKNTDLFVRLEERLNEDFPELKNNETYFEVEARRIKRFKSLDDNKIKNNDIISIFFIEN